MGSLVMSKQEILNLVLALTKTAKYDYLNEEGARELIRGLLSPDIDLSGLVNKDDFNAVIKSLASKDDLNEAIKYLVSNDDLNEALKLLASKDDLATAIKPLASKDDLNAAIKPLVSKDDLNNSLESFVSKDSFDETLESSAPYMKLKDKINIATVEETLEFLSQ